jgi:hypothetical protein
MWAAVRKSGFGWRFDHSLIMSGLSRLEMLKKKGLGPRSLLGLIFQQVMQVKEQSGKEEEGVPLGETISNKRKPRGKQTKMAVRSPNVAMYHSTDFWEFYYRLI